MAKEKLSPRQKMINLMYLVFIAMLAMQIDQEIIRSYYDTNKSLEDTRGLTDKKNKIFEQTLEQKAQNDAEGFNENNENYKILKSKIENLVSFIDGVKGQLKKKQDMTIRGQQKKILVHLTIPKYLLPSFCNWR